MSIRQSRLQGGRLGSPSDVLASLGAVLQFPFKTRRLYGRPAVCGNDGMPFTSVQTDLRLHKVRRDWNAGHAHRAHVLRTILGYPMTTAVALVLKIEMNIVGGLSLYSLL